MTCPAAIAIDPPLPGLYSISAPVPLSFSYGLHSVQGLIPLLIAASREL